MSMLHPRHFISAQPSRSGCPVEGRMATWRLLPKSMSRLLHQHRTLSPGPKNDHESTRSCSTMWHQKTKGPEAVVRFRASRAAVRHLRTQVRDFAPRWLVASCRPLLSGCAATNTAVAHVDPPCYGAIPAVMRRPRLYSRVAALWPWLLVRLYVREPLPVDVELEGHAASALRLRFR